MSEYLPSLTLILILGIGAQWLAWRLRLPSILLLLLAGFVAGPVSGWIDPDALLGEWLMPLVSVSVALILFEGGLTLKFAELRIVGRVVRNLISIGAGVTWAVTTLAARFLFGWEWNLSILLGAILVVTGPTVIMPLLRHVQPGRQVGSTLKWEGIVIDPIGALLALLVYEAILVQELQEVPALAVVGFLKTILVGGVLGALGALVLVFLFKQHLVPDFLQNPVSLMLVVGVFTVSNLLQHESGLLTVTLMGIALANQKRVAIRHIVEFKENLRVLLISALFVLLAARLNFADFEELNPVRSAVFLAVLLFVARPLSVAFSTWNTQLTRNEKLFLAWMAPRGIVAAAVASIFALRLSEQGHPQAADLVPVTFLTIVGTVAIYGLTASPLARWLGISKPNPQGVLIVGANPVGRALGLALQNEGVQVLLADTNRENIHAARLQGLPTYFGSMLAERTREDLDLAGIGRLMALTPNQEVNALTALHFIEFFGRAQVYQLPGKEPRERPQESLSQELRGRLLFTPDLTYGELLKRIESGAVVKKTSLTGEFSFEDFKAHHGANAIPLFVILENGVVQFSTAENPPRPQAGRALISLVDSKPADPRPEGPSEKSPTDGTRGSADSPAKSD
ncbi:MAG TPA: sodium:proton antiporter [Methylomirabilota bacterium]|nr:sodium:proton antiporter [Methylomirabilota bacterium]